MDNFTLLIILNSTIFLSVIFSFLSTYHRNITYAWLWRLSSICLLAGYFLLSIQNMLPFFLSIIIANYLILAGFFLQIQGGISLLYRRKLYDYCFLAGISLLYFIFFPIFTYIRFNTQFRIILISFFCLLLFLRGAWLLFYHMKRKEIKPYVSLEMCLLFLTFGFFYAVRIIYTLGFSRGIRSLLDHNSFVSVTFIINMVYQMFFIVIMLSSSLKLKNISLKKQKDKFHYLFSFLHTTAEYLDFDRLYTRIDTILKDTFGIEYGGIYLVNKGDGSHSLVYSFDSGGADLSGVSEFKKGEGLSGQAIERGTVVEAEVNNYPNSDIIEQLKHMGTEYLASVPIKEGSDIIGAITVVFTENQRRNIFDREFLSFLGEELGILIQNASLYKKITELANHDELTGLFNRRKMIELLDHEIKRYNRSGQPFCVAMADLDHFKSINDRYGHRIGDTVLVAGSSAFVSECRETDYVGRWGGEEFLMLFTHSSLAEVTDTAERIRQSYTEQTRMCTQDMLELTTSLGITEYNPADTVETLIVRADRALYLAKESGRNKVVAIRADQSVT